MAEPWYSSNHLSSSNSVTTRQNVNKFASALAAPSVLPRARQNEVVYDFDALGASLALNRTVLDGDGEIVRSLSTWMCGGFLLRQATKGRAVAEGEIYIRMPCMMNIEPCDLVVFIE